MNKYRITYPNNKEVREYLSTLSLCKAKKSRTTKAKDYGMIDEILTKNEK